MITHDERIAIANRLMREHIDPATRPIGEGALLVVFSVGEENGLMTYISTGDRRGCRDMLRSLLKKWDADAAANREQ